MTIDIPITIRIYAYPKRDDQVPNEARLQQAFERYLNWYSDGRRCIAIEAFESVLKGWATRRLGEGISGYDFEVRALTEQDEKVE